VQAACPLSSYKLALANPVEPHPQLILRRGSSCNSWNKAALWACHMFSFDSSTFALRNSRSEPLKSKGIFCRDCTIGRITVTAMLICVGVGFDSRKGVCHRKIMTCIFPCDMTEILLWPLRHPGIRESAGGTVSVGSKYTTCALQNLVKADL
jgi:hypothetical protein